MPRYILWVALAATVAGVLKAAPAAAIPVFARVYNKPCGACHTVFPQLNPVGDSFRAHGLHGLKPAIAPLRVGPSLDVPGTLPLALYVAAGEDFQHVHAPGGDDSTRTLFNLESFRFLAGGELGPHLSFMVDHELIETEFETGEREIITVPYQAYFTAHAERQQWLANLRAGWYELPLIVSPQIHRLSARPYLIYNVNACSLLGVEPVHGKCEDEPVLGKTQIGLDASAFNTASGFGLAFGFTNGSNDLPQDIASKDTYLQATQVLGPWRVGLFAYYSPDIVGGGAHDHTLRLGPDLDFYSRQFRVLGQFLAEHESNPTGHDQALWYYGGFLEGNYRPTATLLALLRFDYAWTPTFDDRPQGGTTHVRNRLFEITGGWQWLIFENLRAVAEVTYGEEHRAFGDGTVTTWRGTLRLVTAFWIFAPPGMEEQVERLETR